MRPKRESSAGGDEEMAAHMLVEVGVGIVVRMQENGEPADSVAAKINECWDRGGVPLQMMCMPDADETTH